MSLKPCVGCGVLAEQHPLVAVMNTRDVPETIERSVEGPQGFVAVACCLKCHSYPEQRQRPIKGHFFYAADAATAVFHAGSNSLGGGA